MSYQSNYTGPIIDSAIQKVTETVLHGNGWIKLSSTQSEPIDLNTVVNPGNYTTNFYTNGPTGLTINPINMSVYLSGENIVQIISVLGTVYQRPTITSPWNIFDVDGLVFSSATPPSAPVSGQSIWVDTAGVDPILKIFIDGTWYELIPKDAMKKSVYDPENVNKDIYEYIREVIAASGIEDVEADFNTHINNTTIHVSEADRIKINGAASLAQLTEAINALKIDMIAITNSTVANYIAVIDSAKDEIAALNVRLTNHMDNTTIHPNITKQEEWDNKADGTHTHLNDGRVTVDTDHITGPLNSDQLPYDVKERVYVLPDGIGTWKQSTMPTSGRWRGIVYGGDKYVAILGESNKIYYSSNAVLWNEVTLPIGSLSWSCITYGGGQFIALASNSTVGISSTDGIAWKVFSMPASQFWVSAIHGSGKFVAIATNSNSGAMSLDGATWTAFTLPQTREWKSLAYGKGTFLAVASNTTDAASSTDGSEWTSVTLPVSGNWSSTVYGNDSFVIIASNSNVVLSSNDLSTWLNNQLPSSSNWQSITYGSNKFVLVSSSEAISCYSDNGLSWVNKNTTSANMYNVCYGPGQFVALAYGTTENKIMAAIDSPVEEITLDPYHNGDSILITNGEFQRWFLIVDDTLLGSLAAFIEIPIGVSVSWDDITEKPTTMAGYGITDAATKEDMEKIEAFSKEVDEILSILPNPVSEAAVKELVEETLLIQKEIEQYDQIYTNLDDLISRIRVIATL